MPTVSNQTTMSSKISHGLTSGGIGGGGGNVPSFGIREKMTRALKMRAVWAGFLLIVIAYVLSSMFFLSSILIYFPTDSASSSYLYR